MKQFRTIFPKEENQTHFSHFQKCLINFIFLFFSHCRYVLFFYESPISKYMGHSTQSWEIRKLDKKKKTTNTDIIYGDDSISCLLLYVECLCLSFTLVLQYHMKMHRTLIDTKLFSIRMHDNMKNDHTPFSQISHKYHEISCCSLAVSIHALSFACCTQSTPRYVYLPWFDTLQKHPTAK